MPAVSSYCLTQTPVEKTLPRLLEKVLSSNKRAVVLLKDQSAVVDMNKSLWTYTPKGFLPHGSAEDGQPESQPIWLTDKFENPNGAQIIVFCGFPDVCDVTSFERCLEVYSGHDTESSAHAEKRLDDFRAKGYDLSTWYQSDDGAWVQK